MPRGYQKGGRGGTGGKGGAKDKRKKEEVKRKGYFAFYLLTSSFEPVTPRP
jgi:hypothetical protein